MNATIEGIPFAAELSAEDAQREGEGKGGAGVNDRTLLQDTGDDDDLKDGVV